MIERKCPTCQRKFSKPSKRLFCVNCLKLTPHYSALVNRINRGNNYPECSYCGAETTETEAAKEHARFLKEGKNYVRPESY